MLSMLPRVGPAAFALLSLVLAGCAGGEGGEVPVDDVPSLDVTSTTGGIRGIVVDEAIRPISGATIEVLSTPHTLTTDATGIFAFSGLEAGQYFVKASHPLYDVQQQAVEVQAGVADPDAVKFLLTRLVPEDPYLVTIKFDGFIVCSANAEGVGYSEECGEGAGTPCDVAGQPLPPPGCQRVGGQGNNQVQWDITVGAGTKSLVVEQVWEPTSDAGRAFLTLVSTNWVCDPFCGGDRITTLEGESPLYTAVGEEDLEEVVPDETIITLFTYASFTSNPAGVVLNQPYQTFVTTFHYVPAPEGWSFVNGSPDPFA